MTGRNILLGNYEGPGHADRFLLLIGIFSYAYDAQGNLTRPLSGIGQTIDLCALLR